MATKSIDVELLAKMFLAGAQNIEAKKEYINELNVFPVPDGDTGTNMSMTIMAAAKEVTALEGMDMASLAKAISSGSLRGARGNSGVILSQLLRGFTKSIKTESEIDVPALARAAVRAKETAEIFLKGTHTPIIADPRLIEMSFGVYEGIENSFQIPDCPINELFDDPEHYEPVKDGESLQELFARTGEFLEEVIEPLMKEEKNVLIVGHGAMNASIIGRIRKTPLKDFWNNLGKNCELRRLL